MALVNQAEIARRYGVSRKTVTKWKESNWLVMAGDLVDVAATDKVLKKYRPAGNKTVTQTRAKTPAKTAKGNSAGNAKKAAEGNSDDTPRRPRKKAPPAPGTLEFEAELDIATNGANLSLNEAKRVKENYLAKLRELEYQEKSGALVDLAQVEDVLFEEHRSQRDAWQNWPARYGPLIAAELGVEVDPVMRALNEFIHKQLHQLGEPILDLERGKD